MSTSVAGTGSAVTLLARITRAREETARAGLDALLLTPGSDLRYLLGVADDSFERLTCLVVPATGSAAPPLLVLPQMERPRYEVAPLAELGVDVATWVDGEDPYAMVASVFPHGGPGALAVADMMPALHVLALREATGAPDLRLAGRVLRELRMRKDPAELAALRKAGAAIDRVHARMGEWLRPGRTEAEVGADIAEAIVAEGHATVEFVIVGSGPNGAVPHHGVSDRVIESGDVVVVDIGGAVAEGYGSDSTRTYAVGTPSQPDVLATYGFLRDAQQAAVDAVTPGVRAAEVDHAARRVLADAGFGEFFIHRTGHGIGIDTHEEPYIVAGNDEILDAGMTFSIEPGVYLPGRWGARIEDIVAVTDDGVERLNNQPHELIVL
jgi:Xaa-Pro aminopeptidase